MVFKKKIPSKEYSLNSASTAVRNPSKKWLSENQSKTALIRDYAEFRAKDSRTQQPTFSTGLKNLESWSKFVQERIPIPLVDSIALVLGDLIFLGAKSIYRKKIKEKFLPLYKEHPELRKRLFYDLSFILWKNETSSRQKSPEYNRRLKKTIYELCEQFAESEGFRSTAIHMGKDFFRKKIRNLLYDVEFLNSYFSGDMIEFFRASLGDKMVSERTDKILSEDQKQLEFVRNVYSDIIPEMKRRNKLRKYLMRIYQRTKSRAKAMELSEQRNRMKFYMITIDAEMIKKGLINKTNADEAFFNSLRKHFELRPGEFNEVSLGTYAKSLDSELISLRRKRKITAPVSRRISRLERMLKTVRASSFAGFVPK